MSAAGAVVVVGDVMNDVVVRPLAPVAAGTDTPSQIVHSPGGSGANQAAWLAYLGARARFAGRVGAADAGRHRDELQRFGVEVHLAEDAGRATGTVVALVAGDGERSMFTDRGANAALQPDDLPAALLVGAALLHVSGYLLFEPASREAVAALWRRALDAGVPATADPASVAGLRELGADGFRAVTGGASLLFPNIDEGRFLTGEHEPRSVAAALAAGGATVVLKLGAAGALVATPDGRSFPVEAAGGTEVVDSTGAGDAFCAGFLASWVAGADLGTSAGAAVRTAALAVARLGARPPAPA